jgi:perosamine synthetase
MYRLPEVAAALGVAQLEKLDWFVDKREQSAGCYIEAIGDCDWVVPQKLPAGDRNSYFSFAARLTRDDIAWEEFRKKYVEFGGNGVYAAWKLCYQEDSIEDIRNRLLGPIGKDLILIQEFVPMRK